MKMKREKCEICHTEEGRYKCPSCLRRTCSLQCSRRHKTESGCSSSITTSTSTTNGRFVPYPPINTDSRDITSNNDNNNNNNSNNSSSNGNGNNNKRYAEEEFWRDVRMLQRIDSHLTSIDTPITTTSTITNTKNKNSNSNGNNNGNTNTNNKKRRDLLRKQAYILSSVHIYLMPVYMHRSIVNESYYSSREGCIMWTCSFDLRDIVADLDGVTNGISDINGGINGGIGRGDEGIVYAHPIRETMTLSQIFTLALSSNSNSIDIDSLGGRVGFELCMQVKMGSSSSITGSNESSNDNERPPSPPPSPTFSPTISNDTDNNENTNVILPLPTPTNTNNDEMKIFDGQKTLSKCLKGRRIYEFPTFRVRFISSSTGSSELVSAVTEGDHS